MSSSRQSNLPTQSSQAQPNLHFDMHFTNRLVLEGPVISTTAAGGQEGIVAGLDEI